MIMPISYYNAAFLLVSYCSHFISNLIIICHDYFLYFTKRLGLKRNRLSHVKLLSLNQKEYGFAVHLF